MEIIIEQLKTFSPSITQAFNDLLLQLNPKARTLIDGDVKKIIKEPSNSLFIAREAVGGKIVGMLTLVVLNALFAKKGVFEDIVVDKNYRGKGIATRLINEAINKARNEKLSCIDFTSRPEKVAANNLYQHLGFEKRDTNVYRIKL